VKHRHLIIQQRYRNPISQNSQYHQHVEISHSIQKRMLSRQEINSTSNGYIIPVPVCGIHRQTHQDQ
jgi:hypothetical protein